MKEFDSSAYWNERSDYYRKHLDSDYHRNRLSMVDALLEADDLEGPVVDFGCGDGVMSERVLDVGGTVTCVDIDLSMVISTKERLALRSKSRPDIPRFSIMLGGTEVLAKLPASNFRTLMAINVIAYLNKEEEGEFYGQASRLLCPGGVLITSHSNELFDLYTLNKYTVAFFKRHFSTHASMDGIEDLLVHPDKPERIPLPVRENPLSYRHKLETYGFQEQRQEFAILHKLPPLLIKDFDADDIRSRECPGTIGWPARDKWKLMFMCSIFGSRAIKVGNNRS